MEDRTTASEIHLLVEASLKRLVAGQAEADEYMYVQVRVAELWKEREEEAEEQRIEAAIARYQTGCASLKNESRGGETKGDPSLGRTAA